MHTEDAKSSALRVLASPKSPRTNKGAKKTSVYFDQTMTQYMSLVVVDT